MSQPAVDIADLAIHPAEKGFGGPAHASAITAGSLAALRPALDDGWLGSPVALLDDSALRNNVEAMAATCATAGAALYPHGKTTMAPQLVARQLAAGAEGVTVASAQQARLFRSFGVTNVLIANEITDDASIAWLAHEAVARPDAITLCYVDDVEGVELLDRGLARADGDARLRVLVEFGHQHGRTGAPDLAAATSVARAVAASPRLSLAGVAGYEGSLAAATPELTYELARNYCELLGTLAAELLAQGLLEPRPIVTAGGSAYFDAVLDSLAGQDAWQLVLRGGCYLTHDHGLYARVSPFERRSALPTLRPALEVHATVLSRPEPDRVVVGCGRRDISYDAGLPVLLRARAPSGDPAPVDGAVADRLFDQHLVVTVPPSSSLRPGATVVLGVSHPCTTFDKWRWLPVVADGRVVELVRTFF